MPSRQRQQAIILNRKDGKSKGTIIFIKKTGYMNVWVNGKQYYYNYAEHNVDPQRINLEKVISDIEAREQKNKGVIVIRRRR